MKDKGTCPYCKKDFEPEEYGYRLNCPNCKEKIDVFPDNFWIETKWGTFGIQENLLSFLYKIFSQEGVKFL